jgi:hypothetical protein
VNAAVINHALWIDPEGVEQQRFTTSRGASGGCLDTTSELGDNCSYTSFSWSCVSRSESWSYTKNPTDVSQQHTTASDRRWVLEQLTGDDE